MNDAFEIFHILAEIFNQSPPILLDEFEIKPMTWTFIHTALPHCIFYFTLRELSDQPLVILVADDTLFVGEANRGSVTALKALLRCIELLSGLNINFSKTAVYVFNKEDNWANEVAFFLNCTKAARPFVGYRVTPKG